MKRRTFLVSMSAAALPGARFVASPCAATRMALYDPALVQGRLLARHAACTGLPALALDDDIGALWHAQRARLAAHAGRPAIVLCALRGSDRFVFERLATPRGVLVIDANNANDSWRS
ncbi:hypothetical protein [Paraburkholderia sp. J67]|uniref:hypothetical protein n=1 Tax=Paraburkholderia sp. J67 TaxID=2805435 RepID=UPI002ABDEEF9|nr:hypothetical protein [Paraburkholderia sp. J67]